MKAKYIIIIVVVGLLFLALMAAVIGAVVYTAYYGPIYGGRVALIRIEGVITSGQGGSTLFGDRVAGAERIVKLLEDFRKDSSTKSLVLRINSPGGSAAGSQEIYRQIMRVRRDGKKITVSMGDVAASGGYYVASAADRIFADPATLTGSIGVIMETADLHELLDRVGINLSAIKSGKHKDMGSYARPLTPEERKILQGLIDDVYDQFIADVAAGRKILKKEEVRKLADGRVFTGRQALRLKLIDETGGLEDALRAAAKDAGIKGDFSVEEYERPPSLFDILFGTTDSRLPEWLKRSDSLAELARRLLKADARFST
jgi:protease-4